MPRTHRGAVLLAETEPTSRQRRIVGRVVLGGLAVAVAAAGWFGLHTSGLVNQPVCEATTAGTTVDLDPEQMANAATIVGVAMKRDLPARAATIAIATAIQESKLRNVRYGDRDSLGLFQQRPSQGWGTTAQILDPVYAANAFYDALVKIDGYQTMEITKVAQAVQRSAAPEAYAQHEQEGRVLADTIYGYTPQAVGCRLRDAPSAGTSAALATLAKRDLGITATVTQKTVTMTGADAREAAGIAAWTVAQAEVLGIETVTVADHTWSRADRNTTWGTATTKAADRTVVITLAG